MSVYITATYYDCIDKATSIAASYGNSLKERIIIFCEDKLTLSLEQSLVEKTGGSMNAEVCSFGRYIKRRLPQRKTLSKEGAAMTVKKIISIHKNELVSLGKLHASPTFAAETSELIAQLKSAKVSPSDIFSCLPSCPENVAAKIGDVAKIYAAYEDFLKEKGLTDSNNRLSDMVEAIKNDPAMRSSRVIVAGFSSVTKQSAEVTKCLLENSLSADFIAVDGDNEFLYASEFSSFITRLTREKPVALSSTMEEEAKRLIDGLFNPISVSRGKEPTKTNKVRIFEGMSPADEVDYVASYIRHEAVNCGIRYKDVAIAVGDEAKYSLLLKTALSHYDVPFFSDEKRSLSMHPLARLAADATKFAARGGDTRDIKKIISNSLFIPDKNFADSFSAEMTRRAVTAKTFMTEFYFGDMEYDAKRAILSSFVGNFPRRAEAKTYAEMLNGFLSDCGADENAETIAIKLSEAGAEDEKNFLLGAKDDFYSLISEIEGVFGNDEMTAEEFYKILLAGLQSSEISLIQRSADCVFVGNIKDCRYRKYDYLFAVGLSGDVPKVKSDVALLSDGDISRLEKLSVSIEPKIRVVNKREKEACGLAFASFKKRLVMTYPAAAADGTPLSKSEIVECAEKVFGIKPYNRLSIEKRILEGREESDDLKTFGYLALRPALLSLVTDGENFRSGKTSDLSAAAALMAALGDYENGKYLPVAENLLDGVGEGTPDRVDVSPTIYFDGSKVTASLLEKFYHCPYSCFLAYGLNLKETANSEVNPSDVGTLLHRVAEEFVNTRLKDVTSEAEAEKAGKETYEKAFEDEELTKFLNRPDYAYSSELYKKEAAKLCRNLYREFTVSDFRPEGTEVWFGDGGTGKNGKYPPVLISAKKGQYKLSGIVDRMDKYGDYFRIIDYKTGDAKGKTQIKNFYMGLNLQLYLYMNAFAINGAKPAGAYYYAVNDKFSKKGEKDPLMYGKTLNSPPVLEATDKRFNTEFTSEFVNGNLKRASDSIVGEEVFDAYMKYAKILAERAVGMLETGFVGVSPAVGACDYCEYRAACGRDGDGKYRSCANKKISSDGIVKAVSANGNAEETDDEQG